MAAKRKNKPVAKVVGATPPSSGGGTSKSPTPSMSLAMSVLMVGVAFLCGVFTPPSLHAMQQQPGVNSRCVCYNYLVAIRRLFYIFIHLSMLQYCWCVLCTHIIHACSQYN